MVARIIVATAPLGATRVSSLGNCTVRPSESVKAIVSSALSSAEPSAQAVSRHRSIAHTRNMDKNRFMKFLPFVILL